MAQVCAPELTNLQGALIKVFALVVRHVSEQLRPLLSHLRWRPLWSVGSEVFLRRLHVRRRYSSAKPTIACHACQPKLHLQVIQQALDLFVFCGFQPLFLNWLCRV